jgi:hypothetical protein
MNTKIRWTTGVWSLGLAAITVLALSLSTFGCASDDPGHSKTTTKKVEQTPEGTKTTTYTHEKETKVIDKP